MGTTGRASIAGALTLTAVTHGECHMAKLADGLKKELSNESRRL